MNNSDDQNETDEGGKTDDFSENNSYDSDTSINNSDDQNETDERSKTNDSVMNEPDTLDKIKKEIKDLNEYNYTISSHVFNLYGIKISDIDLDTLLNLPDEIQNLDMKSKIIIKDMLFWLFVMKKYDTDYTNENIQLLAQTLWKKANKLFKLHKLSNRSQDFNQKLDEYTKLAEEFKAIKKLPSEFKKRSKIVLNTVNALIMVKEEKEEEEVVVLPTEPVNNRELKTSNTLEDILNQDDENTNVVPNECNYDINDFISSLGNENDTCFWDQLKQMMNTNEIEFENIKNKYYALKEKYDENQKVADKYTYILNNQDKVDTLKKISDLQINFENNYLDEENFFLFCQASFIHLNQVCQHLCKRIT